MSKHTYADSTLKSWTKDELIHQIRILERNLAVKQELINNQAKLLKTWAPVVHGHWIRFKETDPETGYIHMRCSVCSAYWSDPSHADHFRYCPSCGAKMDGGVTNGEDH